MQNDIITKYMFKPVQTQVGRVGKGASIFFPSLLPKSEGVKADSKSLLTICKLFVSHANVVIYVERNIFALFFHHSFFSLLSIFTSLYEVKK
jgi:hypothetical protein